MPGTISAIEYCLPHSTFTSEDIARDFPEWNHAQIETKIGVHSRHIAARGECASDLAVDAAIKLFTINSWNPSDIDYILFCTQSADYVLPTTACLLQMRLGIPDSAGALDFNLGCSGFVYGLGLAEGLISTDQASAVLLLTGDTYSKYLREDDRTTRALFGDGAAAVLVTRNNSHECLLGPFVYGTDGSGANNLIVRDSGARRSTNNQNPESQFAHLYMNGPKIFDFVISVVPNSVRKLLFKAHLEIADVDLFVFHQANAFILEEIRKMLDIPQEKMQVSLSECANTVSSTIPIALKNAMQAGRLKRGDKVLIAGFGVGYSWASALLKWDVTPRL